MRPGPRWRAFKFSVGTATCSVSAYAARGAVTKIAEGAVFRGVDRHGRLSIDAVSKIVQKRALAAGLDPTISSGHSMRAGFAISAAAAEVEARITMRQIRHKSAATVRRHIRDRALFELKLAQEVGL